MKKLLVAAMAAALGVACSSNSSNVKTASARNGANASKDAKYQIIDQEFDNLLAPEADYDTLPAYELQACGDSYLPPAEVKLKGTVKPAAKKAAKTKKTAQPSSKSSSVNTTKKVINNTNIYYLDGTGPDTSATTTTTTTTTYTSDEALPADIPDTL